MSSDVTNTVTPSSNGNSHWEWESSFSRWEKSDEIF